MTRSLQARDPIISLAAVSFQPIATILLFVLSLASQCRRSMVAPPSRWRRWWLAGFPVRSNPLHRFYSPFLPHPRRDPARTRLSASGEDLAGRFLGVHVGKPPLPALSHGGQRPHLAFIGQWARASPAVKPAAGLAGHGPLAAEAVAMANTGATTLLLLAMGAGLCHRGARSMALFIVRLATHVNPTCRRAPALDYRTRATRLESDGADRRFVAAQQNPPLPGHCGHKPGLSDRPARRL
jgi:hypothetical protein